MKMHHAILAVALLAALPEELDALSLSLPDPPTLTCIGRLVAGGGLSASDREGDVPLPETLGYEHRASVSPMGGRL